MYPGHLWNWLHLGQGRWFSSFLLSETGQIWGFLRTQWRNGLKLGMLMYSDHLENSLYFGHSLLIFLIWCHSDLVKQVKCEVSGIFVAIYGRNGSKFVMFISILRYSQKWKWQILAHENYPVAERWVSLTIVQSDFSSSKLTDRCNMFYVFLIICKNPLHIVLHCIPIIKPDNQCNMSIPCIIEGTMCDVALQWRHNDHDGVSNHQPRGCLLNRLFGRRSKKTSKLRVTGLCAGNSPGPVNSPHKGPVTRKMFPFDDVIMVYFLDHTWLTPDLSANISHLQNK